MDTRNGNLMYLKYSEAAGVLTLYLAWRNLTYLLNWRARPGKSYSSYIFQPSVDGGFRFRMVSSVPDTVSRSGSAFYPSFRIAVSVPVPRFTHTHEPSLSNIFELSILYIYTLYVIYFFKLRAWQTFLVIQIFFGPQIAGLGLKFDA